ncbi:putative bacteriophage protein [Burkholderia sp. 8Y]|uniref:phage protein n=1 Tax=Burkholderia sp. 8Y TaxID=2653133 RepID=UPI0012F18F5B|nr:phage protein [Burkholderia sp. 8Y]VXB25148.1 putative bacteriophage protein [Burkholderia sp. 8Y]
MSTYSFLNFNASLIGPGGAISLGSGAGIAEEGFSVEFTEEADNMKIGADGTPMHSLNPSKAGKLTIRLQKTSPTNALLSAMYNFQRTSSANWAQNTFTATDTIRGDVYTCQLVAFTKFPKNDFAKEAGTIEWEFNAGIIDPALAAGT